MQFFKSLLHLGSNWQWTFGKLSSSEDSRLSAPSLHSVLLQQLNLSSSWPALPSGRASAGFLVTSFSPLLQEQGLQTWSSFNYQSPKLSEDTLLNQN